ncbi:MAG: MerR family DNA-binding transcriptional regulator [Xenococcaceae cyanobacterium MO_188.B32]|nr:MerR family DNA-binding transcriptional regulator [Xenococcaceae cyanobacterium MO_188.B32]
MPRYFTIGETADYFGVSVDTIRRWETEGKITSVRTKGPRTRQQLVEERSANKNI